MGKNNKNFLKTSGVEVNKIISSLRPFETTEALYPENTHNFFNFDKIKTLIKLKP